MERMWTSKRKQKREGNSVQRIDDKYATETGDKIFKRRRNNLLKFISIHDTKKNYNPIKTFGWTCFSTSVRLSLCVLFCFIHWQWLFNNRKSSIVNAEHASHLEESTQIQQTSKASPPKNVFILISISISMSSRSSKSHSYSANKDENEKEHIIIK